MAGHELLPKPAGLVIGQERDRGSYGTVHSGELDGKPVVVKKLHHVLLQAPNNDKLLSDFYRECRILSTVRHANVVRFIGAYWDQEAKEPLLVMEAAKENLKQYLERNKAHLGMERQLAICSSMTEGLSFLHGRAEPIIHRDLKPENVLVCENGAVKIGDFGQSKLLDQPQGYMKTTQPGTIAYMPPEALKRNPRYTSKVDVFSLGAVMLEVCTQSSPTVWLEGIGRDPEVERRQDDLALLSDTHPVKPLIIWCLQDNHESRPDVKSTHDQVKLLEGGVKEPDYQQRIHQLETALRKSEEREACVQERLMEAELKLDDNMAHVAYLQEMVERGEKELRDIRMQYEADQKQLISENRLANEELYDVYHELDIATRDLSGARKDKESLEAEVTDLRRTLDAWKATVERRDEECLSRFKELEKWLSSSKCSFVMQLAGEHASKSSTSSIPTPATGLPAARLVSEDNNEIVQAFLAMWYKNPERKPKPTDIKEVFRIDNPTLKSRFEQYCASLSNPNVSWQYHGTSIKCHLLQSKTFCSDTNCGICGISGVGFDKTRIGTHVNWFQRFGRAFCLAPNSSKCHEYTLGFGEVRALLYCQVALGNPHYTTCDMPTCQSPPLGYNSVYAKAGTHRSNKGKLNYDEVAIYGVSEAILPRYIIVYQKDGIKGLLR